MTLDHSTNLNRRKALRIIGTVGASGIGLTTLSMPVAASHFDARVALENDEVGVITHSDYALDPRVRCPVCKEHSDKKQEKQALA